MSRSAAVLSRVARRRRSAAEIPRSCPMRATSNASQAASSFTAALFCQKAFTASTNGLISSPSTFDRDSVCIMVSYIQSHLLRKTLTKCCASCIDLNQIASTAMNPFLRLFTAFFTSGWSDGSLVGEECAFKHGDRAVPSLKTVALPTYNPLGSSSEFSRSSIEPIDSGLTMTGGDSHVRNRQRFSAAHCFPEPAWV